MKKILILICALGLLVCQVNVFAESGEKNIIDKLNFGKYLKSFPTENAILLSSSPTEDDGQFMYIDAQNLNGQLVLTYLGNDYIGDDNKSSLKIVSFDATTGAGKLVFDKTGDKADFQISIENELALTLLRDGKSYEFTEEEAFFD